MEEIAQLPAYDEPTASLELLAGRRVEISKVKLDKLSHVYVEYELRDNDVVSENTRKVHQQAHADLLAAFARLTVHMCLLTEVVEGIRQEDKWLDYYRLGNVFDTGFIYEERLEFLAYHCTGFTRTTDGVVLIGQKRLRGNKVLNLVSPYQALEPEEPTGNEYAYLAELSADLEAATAEAEAYLNGKYSDENRQLDMFEQIEQQVDQVAARQKARKEAGYGPEKFGHFMQELAADKGLVVEMSATIDGRKATRTFAGRELEDE